MSYSTREKRRKNRKIFQVTTILFVFLYFIFRAVPSLLANNAKTILPEKETLIDKFSASGFIIMKESVTNSTCNGDVERFLVEGERIAAGIKVASINSLNDTSSLKQELLQIQESILALKKSETETKLIITENLKIEELQETLINELQDMIALGKYNNIYLLKEQLALYEDKAKDISFTNTLVGKSLDTLYTRKESIEKEISNNFVKYYSNNGGIISYIIDGYEEAFLPKDFENYYYDKLVVGNKLDKSKEESKISVGQPIYKIIDNFEWYIAIRVEDIKDVEDFKINNTLRIYMKDDSQELNGKIVAINTSENKAVIILKLNDKLHDYYNARVADIEVIKSKIDGMKVPTQAIIDKDSIKGVYIKDKSGIVKFRPVIIIGQDINSTYVDIGDNYGNIILEGEEKAVRTITLFDEIFLNTTNIKEGQILN